MPYDRFQIVVVERNKYKADLEALSAQSKTNAEALSRAQQDLEAAKQAEARLRVAVNKGIPPELADRLQGQDEQELAADADRLLPLIRPVSPGVPPPPTPGSRPAAMDLSKLSPAEIRKRHDELMQKITEGA